MNKNLTSYAMDFVSFLIGRIENKDISNIKNIILFGSAARGTADKDSDIDIFVNTLSEVKGTEKRISSAINSFYKTASFRQWKLMGVENNINCIASRLDKWKDLKPSIISDGITLYGKFQGFVKGKPHVIFYWNKVKPESKRVLLSKKLYGFSQNKKRYPGLIENTNALKLGTNCLFVPLESVAFFKKIFKDMKITARMIYVQEVG